VTPCKRTAHPPVITDARRHIGARARPQEDTCTDGSRAARGARGWRRGARRKTAAKLEKAFRTLAETAPTKSLNSAVNTIAAFYGRLADGDKAVDVAKDAGVAFGKAAAKFATYLATQCISSQLSDITLP